MEADRPPSVFRLLFVCTGNTCRSPLAEALARQKLGLRGWSGVEVGSAGVATMDGLPASAGALEVAAESGLELGRHRSTRLTGRVVQEADLVLTMSAGHLARVEELGGAGKAHLLTAFARDDPAGAEEGVPDPFGGSEELYRKTLEVLDELVEGVLRRLEPELEP